MSPLLALFVWRAVVHDAAQLPSALSISAYLAFAALGVMGSVWIDFHVGPTDPVLSRSGRLFLLGIFPAVVWGAAILVFIADQLDHTLPVDVPTVGVSAWVSLGIAAVMSLAMKYIDYAGRYTRGAAS